MVLLKLNSKKKTTNKEITSIPTKKWSKDLNRHFSQRRHTSGQQVCEKMLHITNHQENAN